jgi:integrase
MANIEKRVSQDGKLTYRVKVRLKGFPTQNATFERLTDARKWAQNTESAIREGRHFKTTEAKRRTLNEMLDRYIKDIIPTKPKTKNRIIHLNWWKNELGQYSLAEISPAMIAEKRDKLSSGITKRNVKRSPSTVVRYLSSLSHAFTIAMKEWGWIDDSPMRKVTKPKEPRGRVRFLSDEERSRLLAECKKSESDYLYIAVVLALSTGGRKMEIMSLNWTKDVDLNRGIITLHETKNGERRILPIAGHALELMKEHAKVRHVNCDLVFPSKNLKAPIDLRTPFENALKRAEINDFKWHDLRHSCASYLAMSGASLAEIAEILGHKTLQMVKRYAHLSEAHTSKVVARMNEQIFGM